MLSVLGQLLPLILGAVLAPLWVIIVLLMLASPGGVAKATAFVLGMTLTRAAQGLIFGLVLGATAEDDPGGKSLVASTLLTVVGILLLAAAVRKWRKEEDPDEPPPKWMQSLDQTSPLKALGLGALMVAVGPKLWVFTLSAISVISAAGLTQAGAIAAFAAYVVLAQILLIAAILVAVVAPQGSQATLQRAIRWLNDYNRPISVTVAVIFGIYFTWSGVQGLMAV
jgi:threonine/homoserine/homoserine lactone efflux protein